MRKVIAVMGVVTFLLILLMPSRQVLGLDTGFVLAGTGESTGAGSDWLNPTRVTADDGSKTSSVIMKLGNSKTLRATQFNFASIPDGARLDGIEVKFEKQASYANKIVDATVSLVLSGTESGNNYLDFETPWSISDGITETYGSSADKWGTSYTIADIKNSAFGVDIVATNLDSVSSRTAYVDAVWIRIYYTIVVPTVTTQACDTITATDCLAHGTITSTGGANANTRGFCYKVGTTGDPTTADSKVFDNGGGSYGIGAYSKTISGLTPNTSYRVRAYAINSAGTGYGTSVTVTTLASGFSYSFGYILGG